MRGTIRIPRIITLQAVDRLTETTEDRQFVLDLVDRFMGLDRPARATPPRQMPEPMQEALDEEYIEKEGHSNGAPTAEDCVRLIKCRKTSFTYIEIAMAFTGETWAKVQERMRVVAWDDGSNRATQASGFATTLRKNVIAAVQLLEGEGWIFDPVNGPDNRTRYTIVRNGGDAFDVMAKLD